jgi:hypothetical protein
VYALALATKIQRPSAHLKKYKMQVERIQEKTSQIVNSGFFRYFILAVILLSGVIVGIETYPVRSFPNFSCW